MKKKYNYLLNEKNLINAGISSSYMNLTYEDMLDFMKNNDGKLNHHYFIYNLDAKKISIQKTKRNLRKALRKFKRLNKATRYLVASDIKHKIYFMFDNVIKHNDMVDTISLYNLKNYIN